MIEKHHGELTEGCKRCAEGKKAVIFVTGICPRDCTYCTLGEERKNQDKIYINELEVDDANDLIEEINLSGADSAGITGGDPLSVLPRTIEYIKLLKKTFGKNFHIHLYTSLNLLSESTLKALEEAGLDEFRVHPDIYDKKLWHKLDLLKNTKMETVIEIPAIPKAETLIFDLIKYSKDKVKAFNLNEFEHAPLKTEEYKKQNWKTSSDYSVKGSKKTALNIIKKARAWHVRIHYCSAQFKDEVQFSGRIKNYAKKAALPCDTITKEGLLNHGAIYLTRDIVHPTKKELEQFKSELEKKYHIDLYVDEKKGRLLCSSKQIRLLALKEKHCAIIEEYPTRDRIEVYVRFLSE